ncbi:hypothetical protein LR48_Vigan2313s000100 [Vigna angularis]|nr:hypothetical protein LR48_Vigan2313s000100 [Vigna angularis]
MCVNTREINLNIVFHYIQQKPINLVRPVRSLGEENVMEGIISTLEGRVNTVER